MADGLALLETGRIVGQGTVDEIKKKFGVGYNLKIHFKENQNLDSKVRELKKSV